MDNRPARQRIPRGCPRRSWRRTSCGAVPASMMRLG